MPLQLFEEVSRENSQLQSQLQDTQRVVSQTRLELEKATQVITHSPQCPPEEVTSFLLIPLPQRPFFDQSGHFHEQLNPAVLLRVQSLSQVTSTRENRLTEGNMSSSTLGWQYACFQVHTAPFPVDLCSGKVLTVASAQSSH